MANKITVFKFDAGGYYSAGNGFIEKQFGYYNIVDNPLSATKFKNDRHLELMKYFAGHFETFELARVDK